MGDHIAVIGLDYTLRVYLLLSFYTVSPPGNATAVATVVLYLRHKASNSCHICPEASQIW